MVIYKTFQKILQPKPMAVFHMVSMFPKVHLLYNKRLRVSKQNTSSSEHKDQNRHFFDKYSRAKIDIPDEVQHSFQTHPHFQSHHEEHLEEPSKIHQQTPNPFAYCSAICHLQDIGRPISAHVENNETAEPMFQQLVLLYSYGIYTNVIKLNCIKDSEIQ